MKFARTVWKILVAIKDALVLVLLLLFFGALSMALSGRPAPGHVRDGALAITLDGPVVEERTQIGARSLLLGGGTTHHQYLAREVVRAIEAAAGDARIHAVTLDLEDFGGASRVNLSRIGAALDHVRRAGKPVLVRAVLYEDGSYQLAAHASEVWADPLGGVMLRGPGGTMLFYHDLLDRLKVHAHVFKVGTYKSAVEPFVRNNLSPEARDAETKVLAALWQDYQDEVHQARPRANLAMVTGDPAKWINDAGGDTAKAAMTAGLIDHIGDKAAFDKHVAELVGADKDDLALPYKATTLRAYLARMPAHDTGKAIAVVTVAGDIVDGDAGPGKAGGDRIAALIDKAAASGDYAGLVVRVDSPGGSVLASERIRSAIARFKAKGAPVAVSMGGLAASGGYWVSTAADRIFAEPTTITGSIGIFAVIPSFEDTLAKAGIGADSVRTTPLSGQPDVLGGLSPAVESVVQADIAMGYRRFVGLVAASRHKTPEAVDQIAQGRVWDGGTARQLGLVDEFGDAEQALAWVAKRAGADRYHPVWLGAGGNSFAALLEQALNDDQGDSGDEDGATHDLTGHVARAQIALAGQVSADLDRLMGGHGAQAYCLACAGLAPPAPATPEAAAVRAGWWTLLFGAR